MRFDDEKAREAVRMLGSPHMKPLVDFLQAEANLNIASLISLTEVAHLHRAQGKAQFLHDLLSAVKKLNA